MPKDSQTAQNRKKPQRSSCPAHENGEAASSRGTALTEHALLVDAKVQNEEAPVSEPKTQLDIG